MKYGFRNLTRKKKDILLGIFVVLAFIGLTLTSLGVLSYFKNYNNQDDPDPTTITDAGNVKGTNSCKEEALKTGDIFKEVTVSKRWMMKGEEFLPDDKEFEFIVQVKDKDLFERENLTIDYIIVDTSMTGELQTGFTDLDVHTAEINTDPLPAGNYKIKAVVEAECGTIHSNDIDFYVSYPLYMTWTYDWEGADVKQQYLNDVDELANKYSFPLTHMFNPRIMITSALSDSRRQYLIQWVKDRRDTRGDSIGMHMHMYFDMVKAAGVESQTAPAWGWYYNDGYDVLVSGYSYEKMDTLLKWGLNQFQANGLGRPISFRAGGWFADEGTLQVLEDNGFLIETSGRTPYSIGTNNTVSPWLLTSTTQPYHPNKDDQNATGGNMFKTIWEFPNNGGDSYGFSKEEMFNRYRDNYNGTPLTEKTVVTYLSHPEWYYEDKPKMDALLADISNDLYSKGTGPVIFVTLEDAYANYIKE